MEKVPVRIPQVWTRVVKFGRLAPQHRRWSDPGACWKNRNFRWSDPGAWSQCQRFGMERNVSEKAGFRMRGREEGRREEVRRGRREMWSPHCVWTTRGVRLSATPNGWDPAVTMDGSDELTLPWWRLPTIERQARVVPIDMCQLGANWGLASPIWLNSIEVPQWRQLHWG